MFSVPELVVHLVQYLTPKDMARCLATCKTFASLFEPHLYRRFVLQRGLPVPDSLLRNAHHLRSIEIRHTSERSRRHKSASFMPNMFDPTAMAVSMTSIVALLSATGLTNLQSFVINENNRFLRKRDSLLLPLDSVISALKANSHITHLELPMEDLVDPSGNQRLLNVIDQDLPRLQRLVIDGRPTAFTVSQAVALLRVCFRHPQLTDLQCHADGLQDYSVQDTTTGENNNSATFQSLLKSLEDTYKADDGFKDATECRLKSLKLPKIKEGYPQSFLIPLLKALPNLERFEVPALNGPYEEDTLERVIAEHCPKLRHVSHTITWLHRCNSGVVKAVIRGCARSGLKSFRVSGYSEMFDGDPSRRMIETLVKHHSKTLEAIEIQGWWGLGDQPRSLNPIFTGCPNLKTFKVLPVDRSRLNHMNFTDIPLHSWVFQDLKELHLHFAQMDQFIEDKATAEEELEAGEKVMKQIGKLTKLQTLVLEFTGHDYYSDSSWDLDPERELKWLKELVGLRKLRYLGLPYDVLKWANQVEMEVLDSIWPQLEVISCRDNYAFLRILAREQWQWLKKRRPLLELGDGDYGNNQLPKSSRT